MTFRFTFTACVSPRGNQPIQNVRLLKPVGHCDLGDMVYNDSQAIYTLNGYTMNPSIFWDFVATPNGAPANAMTAQYCFDRYEKHFGRTGLRNYRDFQAGRDAGEYIVRKIGDDHDYGYNNQDHSLPIFKAGFPISTNAAYGQIVDDANFTQAQALQCWLLGQAGGRLIEAAYSDNPPRGAPNGDIPSAMVGTAVAANYDIKYFYQDWGANGKLGAGNCIREIFTDSISYKSPASATDNSSKHFFGLQQEAWILATLQDAANKGFGMNILYITKDLFGVDNGDGPQFYTTRMNALLTAIHNANYPVVVVCGDKHAPAAGISRVSNGRPFDLVSVCACPAGQGIGNRTHFPELVWMSVRNDQCLVGMIEVDPVAREVTVHALDFYSLDSEFSVTIPFGQRLPSRTTVAPGQTFMPAQSPTRVAPTVTASPFNYQNTTNRPQLVVIKGGTVSLIEYSNDNTTFDDTGANKGQFLVLPGHWLRTTYSVAPTVFAVYPFGWN